MQCKKEHAFENVMSKCIPVILLCSLSTETLSVEGLKTKNDVKAKVKEWKEEVKERSLTHKKLF